MKYVVQMGSGAMIYITKFRKDWFSHSEFDKGDTQTDIHTGTQRAWRLHKPTLFFLNKENSLKTGR
jgi:hypothetical protein